MDFSCLCQVLLWIAIRSWRGRPVARRELEHLDVAHRDGQSAFLQLVLGSLAWLIPLAQKGFLRQKEACKPSEECSFSPLPASLRVRSRYVPWMHSSG